jgi:phage regulator Rha-like protein
VEDRCESAMVSQALETLRYCLFAFTGTTLGSTSNGDGSPGEFILEALNESGDSEDCDGKGYDSDEYDAAMKQFEDEITWEELEEKLATARQVFVTNKRDDVRQGVADRPSHAAPYIEAAKEQGNPPLAANTAMEGLPEIQGGSQPLEPDIPMVHRPEDFVTPVDTIVYGPLGDPITPNYVKDVNNLEKKRREVLKEAKRVEKMGKKLDGNIAQAQDALKHARNMEEKYVTLIQQQFEEGNDPQLIRNLEFTVPTAETLARMYIKNPPYMDKNCDEVRATLVENIVATKELLENKRTPTTIETTVKLMTKALVQQEKATSSQRRIQSSDVPI